MKKITGHAPLLHDAYERYLEDSDSQRFTQTVSERYLNGTLEHLVRHPLISIRRSAVLALSFLGDFSSTSVLAQALYDKDSVVQMLAENALRSVWRRDASLEAQESLAEIIRLNTQGDYIHARMCAMVLLVREPEFAEVWFQRGHALQELKMPDLAFTDFMRCTQLNPFHFPALMRLGDLAISVSKLKLAYEYFHRALALNPRCDRARVEMRRILALKHPRE